MNTWALGWPTMLLSCNNSQHPTKRILGGLLGTDGILGCWTQCKWLTKCPKTFTMRSMQMSSHPLISHRLRTGEHSWSAAKMEPNHHSFFRDGHKPRKALSQFQVSQPCDTGSNSKTSKVVYSRPPSRAARARTNAKARSNQEVQLMKPDWCLARGPRRLHQSLASVRKFHQMWDCSGLGCWESMKDTGARTTARQIGHRTLTFPIKIEAWRSQPLSHKKTGFQPREPWHMNKWSPLWDPRAQSRFQLSKRARLGWVWAKCSKIRL